VATTRRMPRLSELRELLKPRRLPLNPVERSLATALTIGDLRTIARRRTPRPVFDYTDGAAEEEVSLRRAREAYASVEFRPNVLRDVQHIDLGVEVFGRRSELPFMFSPTGFTRMMQHEGEIAVVRVAERAGIPYSLSTLGTSSIEDVAAAAPSARKWFQLYVWKDRGAGKDLIQRAKEQGYEAVMLTVDTAVAGLRLRDVRNGLTIPPSLTLRTFASAAIHPNWWINLLTTEPLTFASLTRWQGTVAELMDEIFDPTLSLEHLDWLRELWDGPLLVKGVLSPDDARTVVDHGADGVVVSHHGGRQLDRATPPLLALPRVLNAVGDRAEVYVDTGILNGGDVVTAMAHGAKATMIGRAYLYGLMAGGERGVQRAVDILTSEVKRTMRLLGVRSMAELTPEHAKLPPGLTER
jgi:L-lactate dehydrogenase (cytochrome)